VKHPTEESSSRNPIRQEKQRMASFSAQLLKAFTRRTIKRDGITGDALVQHLRRHMNMTQPQCLPTGTSAQTFQLAGFHGTYVSVAEPELTILYFHGGAFVAGRTQTYHNLAGRLAKALGAQVFLPDYPLAPEHPFPAGVDYCFDLYRYLLEEEKIKPEKLVLMGDSAGGGLVFATLLGAKREGLPMPRCSVTFSPGVNIRGDDDSLAVNADKDAMLSATMIREIPGIYAKPSDWDNPLASPILGDYTGTTPVFISSCREECLYGSNKKMASRLRHQGVSVRWLERFDLVHVWPVFVPWLSEAREDFAKIAAFIHQPEKC
jgi:acetyl esterase/lipase